MYRRFHSFEEMDKYMNWYNAINEVPVWMICRSGCFGKALGEKTIITHATFGSISTPYFEKEFYQDIFELQESLTVVINVPYDSENDKNYGNTTWKIKYDIEGNYECITIKSNGYSVDCVDPRETELKFETRNDGIKISFRRNIPILAFEDWRTKRSTGFSVQWEFVSDITTIEEFDPIFWSPLGLHLAR